MAVVKTLTILGLHPDDDVGGAIGMYPNGLRIIRDIDPQILANIRASGSTFEVRRWMRHDGSQVAIAEENYLCDWDDDRDRQDRLSIGIRRWRLQKILYEACVAAKIPIYFNERLAQLSNANSTNIHLVFDSAKTTTANFVSIYSSSDL